MMQFLSSLSGSRLSGPSRSMREPSRCPYHPNLPAHWNKHGSYQRQDPTSPADDPKMTSVPRCRCNIILRTFSIPPDALLPYLPRTTESILQLLHCVIVEGHGSFKASEILSIPRTTLRRIIAKFHTTVKLLRLPEHPGVLAADAFLRRLFALGLDAIVELFAEWKEREPKFSLVGIYPR